MPRISLQSDEQLTSSARQAVQAVEASGADASVLRAAGHCQEMFDQYFQFYYPAHQEGIVEGELKELVRLKIARLNDCFT